MGSETIDGVLQDISYAKRKQRVETFACYQRQQQQPANNIQFQYFFPNTTCQYGSSHIQITQIALQNDEDDHFQVGYIELWLVSPQYDFKKNNKKQCWAAYPKTKSKGFN